MAYTPDREKAVEHQICDGVEYLISDGMPIHADIDIGNIHLLNLADSKIDPATENKQDDVIAQLAFGTGAMAASHAVTIATDDTQFAALLGLDFATETTLSTLDGKVTACDTGAVVTALGTPAQTVDITTTLMGGASLNTINTTLGTLNTSLGTINTTLGTPAQSTDITTTLMGGSSINAVVTALGSPMQTGEVDLEDVTGAGAGAKTLADLNTTLGTPAQAGEADAAADLIMGAGGTNLSNIFTVLETNLYDALNVCSYFRDVAIGGSVFGDVDGSYFRDGENGSVFHDALNGSVFYDSVNSASMFGNAANGSYFANPGFTNGVFRTAADASVFLDSSGLGVFTDVAGQSCFYDLSGSYLKQYLYDGVNYAPMLGSATSGSYLYDGVNFKSITTYVRDGSAVSKTDWSALTAPGSTAAFSLDSFVAKDHAIAVTVANINTNVVVKLEGSFDGTSWFDIITDQTILANGTTSYVALGNTIPTSVRGTFVSEAGGTDASVTIKYRGAR